MQFQSDDVLENSPVVANCRMNRERNLHGPNGYDRDLRFDPLALLKDAVNRNGEANWLDLCCGTAKALAEAAGLVEAEGLPIQITGVDLAGLFVPYGSASLTLHQAGLSTWQPDCQFDLITCVHGLLYIGDKLGLIVRAAGWLKDDGQFVANLDMANIRLGNGQSSSRIVAPALRRAGFDYSSRHRLISCDGMRECELPFRYLGADDDAGPNYTGQPAVNSYYERLT